MFLLLSTLIILVYYYYFAVLFFVMRLFHMSKCLWAKQRLNTGCSSQCALHGSCCYQSLNGWDFRGEDYNAVF